jgi:hypothetical protein
MVLFAHLSCDGEECYIGGWGCCRAVWLSVDDGLITKGITPLQHTDNGLGPAAEWHHGAKQDGTNHISRVTA